MARTAATNPERTGRSKRSPARLARAMPRGNAPRPYTRPMHFDAHQPVIDDLEARITAIRDSL